MKEENLSEKMSETENAVDEKAEEKTEEKNGKIPEQKIEGNTEETSQQNDENDAGGEHEEGFDPSGMFMPTDVYMISQMMISLMANSAWQHLGLIPDPRTKKIEKNMNQARIAIDTISFLFDKIENELEKEPAKEIRNLLSNLRVNFVQKSGDKE